MPSRLKPRLLLEGKKDRGGDNGGSRPLPLSRQTRGGYELPIWQSCSPMKGEPRPFPCKRPG
jgi:hypothetical protein